MKIDVDFQVDDSALLISPEPAGNWALSHAFPPFPYRNATETAGKITGTWKQYFRRKYFVPKTLYFSRTSTSRFQKECYHIFIGKPKGTIPYSSGKRTKWYRIHRQQIRIYSPTFPSMSWSTHEHIYRIYLDLSSMDAIHPHYRIFREFILDSSSKTSH